MCAQSGGDDHDGFGSEDAQLMLHAMTSPTEPPFQLAATSAIEAGEKKSRSRIVMTEGFLAGETIGATDAVAQIGA